MREGTLQTKDTITPELSFRSDIQVLRGVAVLLVVLFHANLGIFPAGFFGVDVFFVVSGFLIAQLIVKGLDNNRFNLPQFYLRRAKRLIPASYATLLLTALLAIWLLEPAAYESFLLQLWGSLTFTANIVFWSEVGYFRTAAELKPLLHMWSLSLEEQYYLLLPLTLMILPRRMLAGTMMLGFLLSLGLFLVLVEQKPSATFFWLPTRAWQLALGGYIAVAGLDKVWQGSHVRWLRYLAWCLLLVPCLGWVPAGYGKLAPLVVCLATSALLILHPGNSRPNSVLIPLYWIGDRSYSLYLLHWPIFSFLSVISLSQPPALVRVGAIALSMILASLLYKYLERPIHYLNLQNNRRFVLGVVAMTAILAAGPAVLNWARGSSSDPVEFEGFNYGLGSACEFGERFVARDDCISGDSPSTVVWGDSFAMQYSQPAALSSKGGIVQATKSSCAPILGTTFFSVGAAYNPFHMDRSGKWARDCISFNSSVYQWILDNPGIKNVVLSARLGPWDMTHDPDSTYRILRQVGDGFSEDGFVPADVEAQLKLTIEKLQAEGKAVHFVAPTPMAHFDAGRCAVRLLQQLPAFGGTADCSFKRGLFQPPVDSRRTMLGSLKNATGMMIVDPSDALCEENKCAGVRNSKPIYADRIGHLTHSGSSLLNRQFRFLADSHPIQTAHNSRKADDE